MYQNVLNNNAITKQKVITEWLETLNEQANRLVINAKYGSLIQIDRTAFLKLKAIETAVYNNTGKPNILNTLYNALIK